MLLVTWLFDKMGYMPKIAVETNWPFPATAKKYTPHEFEVSKDFNPRPVAKKVAKKTSSVKIPKATTRKPKTK